MNTQPRGDGCTTKQSPLPACKKNVLFRAKCNYNNHIYSEFHKETRVSDFYHLNTSYWNLTVVFRFKLNQKKQIYLIPFMYHMFNFNIINLRRHPQVESPEARG